MRDLEELERENERLRRELTRLGRGEVIEGGSRVVKPRTLGKVMSLRLSTELATDLRQTANEMGMSTSELLRMCVSHYIASRRAQRLGNGSSNGTSSSGTIRIDVA